MRRLLASAVLFVSSAAFAASGPATPTPAKPVSTAQTSATAPALLPQSFSGWKVTAQTPSATANAVDGPVLQEYGLQQYATANYTSGANHLEVRAWRFSDATGAFGAFTFYRQPQMRQETIGRDGAVDGNHFVFWTGATVVEANFSAPSGREKVALQALAGEIPQAFGNQGVPPSLPHYLPQAQLDPATVRYVIGPAAYARRGGALPATAIDFGLDAEVVSAEYGAPDAQGTLTLIMYPTPQIAGNQLKTIRSTVHTAGVLMKRSGPLIAVLSGSYPAQKAQQLIGAVHFNDYVTINHPEGYVSEAAKLSRLLLGIAALTGILLTAALLLGIFLGGGRALIRMLRGKPASSVSEEEFISLHLGG